MATQPQQNSLGIRAPLGTLDPLAAPRQFSKGISQLIDMSNRDLQQKGTGGREHPASTLLRTP